MEIQGNLNLPNQITMTKLLNQQAGKEEEEEEEEEDFPSFETGKRYLIKNDTTKIYYPGEQTSRTTAEFPIPLEITDDFNNKNEHAENFVITFGPHNMMLRIEKKTEKLVFFYVESMDREGLYGYYHWDNQLKPLLIKMASQLGF